jgi:hypothetical protein
MNQHTCKIWPKYYDMLASGKKNFELRKHNRDYKIGDQLLFMEWNPKTEEYTGRSLKRKIIYILRSSDHDGLEGGYSILGMANTPRVARYVESFPIQCQNCQWWSYGECKLFPPLGFLQSDNQVLYHYPKTSDVDYCSNFKLNPDPTKRTEK